MTDMGVPSGYIWSSAPAINERGVIAGISEGTNGLRSAIAWYKGAIATLPTLGGDNAFANDINASGDIIGLSENSAGDSRATLWRRTKK